MSVPMKRVISLRKSTINLITCPSHVVVPTSNTSITASGSAGAIPFGVTRLQGLWTAPLSAAPRENPTASPETAMPDLELAAQRVRQLEAEAIAMHELAQRLNKEGRFEEAQAAYASMHRLEDEASELAARVGCVACVLGEPGEDQEQGQPSLCTLDPAVLLPYEQLIEVPPWHPLSLRGSEAPDLQDQGQPPLQPQPRLQWQPRLHPQLQQDEIAQPLLQLHQQLPREVSELEARTMGCVLGSALADAAAMGVHWVYDLGVLDELEQERRQRQLTATAIASDASPSVSPSSSSSGVVAFCPPEHPFTFGLEFMDPPRSPFYSYTSGRNSPYGEQMLVLLRSLAESTAGGGWDGGGNGSRRSSSAGVGLHCGHYAALFAQTFGPESGFDGYRDVSTKGFLRNYGRGFPPPLSGASDAQANCVVRLAPLVAAFAAGPTAVVAASSSFQSSPCDEAEGLPEAGTTEYGTAGSRAAAAGADCGMADPLLRCVELATRVTQNTDAAVAWASVGAAVLEQLLLGSTAEAAVRHIIHDLRSPQGRLAPFVRGMGPEIVGHLTRALELRTEPVPAAVEALGRNCHMPNALQTPLHVVLHVEDLVRRRSTAPVPATRITVDTPAAVTGLTNDRGVITGPDSAGIPSDSRESGRRGDAADAWLAALPAEAYMWGVRLAVREGGCCASRAAFVGACLGTMVTTVGPKGAVSLGLPEEWLERYSASGQVRAWAEILVKARERAGKWSQRHK